ncbi:MAG UNVERIFIED_CONTAM: hypothetical protein LVR29_20275 [Microcystis novacekii LVE1205-3]
MGAELEGENSGGKTLHPNPQPPTPTPLTPQPLTPNPQPPTPTPHTPPKNFFSRP